MEVRRQQDGHKVFFRKKHSFQNPFRQNYKHMKAIEWVMEQQLPCISIAVFNPKCSLKRVNVHSKDKHVLNYNDLKKMYRILY